MASRDGTRPLRRRLAGRLAGRRLTAAGARGAGRAGASGRLRADGRLRARVLSPEGELRRGARQALPRPDAVGAVHPGLLDPRDHLRRGADPADPERDAGRGHRRRELEGRGLAGPARDQLPLRRRCPHGRQPRGLQERRQGDRERERLLDHLHGEARPRVDRELVPRPREPVARRRERVRRRERGVRRLPRRLDRLRARAGALPGAERELVQALRGRQLGADDPRLGARQPHVRLPHRRPRCLAARRDEDPGRRRQPVPRVRGADRGRPARDRARARASTGTDRQRVRVRRGAFPVDAARGDRRPRGRDDGPRQRSATRSSTTT